MEPKIAVRAASSVDDDLKLDRNGNPLTGFDGDIYYEYGKQYTGSLFGFQYVDGVRADKINILPDQTVDPGPNPIPDNTAEPSPEPDPTPIIDGPTIIDYSQETEFGSMGYLLGLLNLPLKITNYNADGSRSQSYSDIVKDETGRVIGFKYNSSQAVLNPLVNFVDSYEISYDENGQITVTRQHLSTIDNQAGPVVTKTFDEQKRPVSVTVIEDDVVKSVTTYTYDDNVTTVTEKDGEDNVLRIKTITKNTNGTTSTKIEKPDGSWETTVTDKDGNFVSKEGKAVLAAYPAPQDDTIPVNSTIWPDGTYMSYPYPDGTTFEFNGMTIINKNIEPAEVKYSMNADGEIIINGNNLEVIPNTYYYDKGGSSVYGLARYPGWHKTNEVAYDNLIIKGNNNDIKGSSADDNVKVVGNNNQVDLGDGVDTANVIGDNNTVKNTENLNSRTKEIPAGEVGSLKYLVDIMQLDIYEGITGVNHWFPILETDDEGRVIRFAHSSQTVVPYAQAVMLQSYTVSYSDNGGISVTEQIPNLDGGSITTKTFDVNGKLIKEKSVNQSINPMQTVETTYGDGITTTVTTLGDPEKPKSIETRYITDDYVSVFKDEYEYYDNGNVKSQTHIYVKDDVQFKKVTTTYDENCVMTSKTGEMTIQANEVNFVKGLIIRNPGEENISYSYSIDADGKLTINADKLEITPAKHYFGYIPEPFKVVDYKNGTIVEINNEEEFNDLIDSEFIIDFDPPELLDYDENNLNNVTINGNKNIIRGSIYNDTMTVKGNNNEIDLGDGSDKLTVLGYKNIIKNVEEIISNPNE